MVSDNSVSDMIVDERFSSFNDFSLLKLVGFMIDNLAREVLFHKFSRAVVGKCFLQRMLGLDAASNDGNAGEMSTDCQIFVF